MNKNYNLLEIKTNKLVNSLFVGNYKTNFKSRGIEFVDFREYNVGDDVKNIDFSKSAKEGKILVKLYEEERELSVYFLINIDDSIEYNFGGKTKREIIEEIIFLIGLSAIKGGDKIGTYIFGEKNRELKIAKKGKSSLINILNTFDYFIKNNEKNLDKNKISNLDYFNSLKINKSLILLITSNLELNEKQLKILALKNDLVVCNVFHSFENTLNSSGIKGLTNGDNNYFIDLSDEKKRQEYCILRNEKINNFKRKVRKYGARYIFIDETTNIYGEFLKLMKEKS